MPFVSPGTYYSQATTGYLSTLSLGTTASPDSYTAILEIRSIKSNNFTVPEVDCTTLQSPNATEESIPGLVKPGTIEGTGNFIGDTTQLSIPASGIGQNIMWYKIVASVQRGAKTYTQTGSCYVIKWEVGPFENNKATDVSFSLKVSGTITEHVA